MRLGKCAVGDGSRAEDPAIGEAVAELALIFHPINTKPNP